MNQLSRRQVEIVEFAEKVYHSGLRHSGVNGTLYENKLIQFLREDVPKLDFYRGQIRYGNRSSSQYDIIICKKGIRQHEFLKEVDPFVNIIDESDCLGVIELKKWGNPKMISPNGSIENAYRKFKSDFPDLSYLFVTIRFKDRKRLKEKKWIELSDELRTDGNFCFFGNVYNSDKEWEFPWVNNKLLIERNRSYLGEYERLIRKIEVLSLKVPPSAGADL
ncbi:hypothetical protein [uncultured Sunxiuqinia sp.]|uniref:hypothetical protein n=1 Tax=uncultured Sunxiuqinia sp. TaxID=1573825 RepID=UPI0026354500|nr:hypothetical protein [uncultured Sunxiuqinia sp.]